MPTHVPLAHLRASQQREKESPASHELFRSLGRQPCALVLAGYQHVAGLFSAESWYTSHLPEEAPTAVSTGPELGAGDGVNEDVAVCDVVLPVGTVETIVNVDLAVGVIVSMVAEDSMLQKARKRSSPGMPLPPALFVFSLIQEEQLSYAMRKAELGSQSLGLFPVDAAMR
ncbi:hypothetical protein J3458_002807 [Metarhizium acridum]|uniref:uncharacterized protein n=1 Tax=Metarhizium acridum TaxID=92637 RepID=UPI001C6C8780|nr:hypothetical protein J3458_002807 [Metarhizium acridum]